METINIFSAENIEGRVDVACAKGSVSRRQALRKVGGPGRGLSDEFYRLIAQTAR
jgi:hypothetical protein